VLRGFVTVRGTESVSILKIVAPEVSRTVGSLNRDDNGIELYRDRPEEEWPRAEDGSMSMISEPLDLRALLAEAD
jgi:hypothetical protein